MSDVVPGARVAFVDDASIADPYEPVGIVVYPTDEEVGRARAVFAERGVGPDHGDLLVEWDDGGRAWVRPSDLVALDQA